MSCLSKIGKDLYMDFDAMDGLTLRTLNDAKSAYCQIEFAPAFFERCTTPVGAGTAVSSRKRSHSAATASSSTQSTNGSSQELRFTCRVPLRALAPIVRPRKGIVNLRIKSNGTSSSSRNSTATSRNNEGDNLQLSFEFQLEISSQDMKPTWCKAVHKLGVAEVDNIAAVASKDESSELVASPKMLLKWLEPIKRTAEACLMFTKNATSVVATSFSSEATGSSLASATKNILRTETSIALEDLEDFVFVDRRNITQLHHQQQQEDNHGMPQLPMPDNVNEEVILVFGIKEAKAMLQFCSQAASMSSSSTGIHWGDHHGGGLDETRDQHHPWSVALSFHWAGKPLIWESKGNSVSIQLVLATLDHQILKDMPIMTPRDQTH
jgi:hypothetical protein